MCANIRKSRGYTWEDTIVKKLKSKGWYAFRLGSPSIRLPDVVAVKGDTMLAIEAKSGTTDELVVEKDQIERCIRWLEAFSLYNRYAILAFKFLSKKWKSVNRYKRREKREYFKIWYVTKISTSNDQLIESSKIPNRVICKYNGTVILDDGNKREVKLEDYEL